MSGKSIELFLTEGTPGGLIVAEVSNWVGKVISFSRQDLKKFNARDEARHNGVYILLGEDPDSINSLWCYIGKTENFLQRLQDHNAKKKEWEQVIVISSSQDALNEGCWGYMEAMLLTAAQKAERCSVDANKQQPIPRKLSEAQKAAVEDFINTVKMVLPVLGVDIFRSPETPVQSAAQANTSSEVFYIRKPKHGIEAKMQYSDGEYFLLKGSTVAAQCTLQPTTASSQRSAERIISKQKELLDKGSLLRQGDIATVQHNISFKSPSTAASVALGRTSNGRKEWRNAQGMSFHDWENQAQ